jgi:tetratricopeptide (TPR) repeat protein
LIEGSKIILDTQNNYHKITPEPTRNIGVKTMLVQGILLAVMADMGPLTEINISKLDETSAMKLSISLLTALGLGESQDQLNQLHGSFPVPGRKELALAYPFLVTGDKSDDPRIQASGRYCTIFLLFDREAKTRILSNYQLIETLIKRKLEKITTQEELNKDLMNDLFTTIETEMSTKEGKSAPAAIKQSAADLEQIRIDHNRHQILSSIIREVTQIQTIIASLLDEFMIFTDTPILEGALYMRPNIRSDEFLKILPKITQYERILARLDGEDKDTVKEILEISLLVRIGNLFYWKALGSQQMIEFEKAIEFYLRANQLKDDSILYLTIGSIYRKIGRSEEGKDWIENGFSRMRKRKESIRISRNMLFGDIH